MPTVCCRAKFDLVIFLTGVGVRALLDIAQTKYKREDFIEALRSVKIGARGPKPAAALRELKIPVAATAPEPNTWREMMHALEAEFGEQLSGMRVAVQEYGASNPEFLSELTVKCGEVTKVPVYQWTLPEDVGPLRECVLGVANGSVDVVLFMTAVQVIHLFQVAEEMGLARRVCAPGLMSMVVVSIGPTTSEELAHYGITPDFEPSHPKMGFLVNEAAQYSGKILERKRGAGATAMVRRRRIDGDKPAEKPKSGVRRVARFDADDGGFSRWAYVDRFSA